MVVLRRCVGRAAVDFGAATACFAAAVTGVAGCRGTTGAERGLGTATVGNAMADSAIAGSRSGAPEAFGNVSMLTSGAA